MRSYISEQLLLAPQWRERVQLEKLQLDQVSVPTHIVMAEDLSSQKMIEVVVNKKIEHIIQRSPAFTQELNTSALMLVDPDRFMFFPLSSILTPLHADFHQERTLKQLEIRFTSTSQRPMIRELIDKYLEELDGSKSICADVHLITDELITNAIYNAPYDESEARWRLIDELPKGQSAKLFFGCRDQRLVIGCIDYYGTLKPLHLLDRIHKCASQGVYENIRWEKSRGAGIGAFMIYDRSCSLFIGVKPGKKTIVCSEIYLSRSERRRAGIPKCIHWFLDCHRDRNS